MKLKTEEKALLGSGAVGVAFLIISNLLSDAGHCFASGIFAGLALPLLTLAFLLLALEVYERASR